MLKIGSGFLIIFMSFAIGFGLGPFANFAFAAQMSKAPHVSQAPQVSDPKTKLKSNRYEMKINGMVCNLCVQSIKNRMMKNKEVQSVEILLDQKQVVVLTKPGQDISTEKIKESITDTGYTPEELKRIE